MEEMGELLDFLSQREDYCIFAGFASKILLGVSSSADVDVLAKDMNLIVNELGKKGWSKTIKTEKVIMLQKDKTEIDVCKSEIPELFDSRSRIKYSDWELYVMSPEALFITKMNNQLAKEDRSEDKTKRDRETIKRLRGKIDPEKLRKLILKLPDEFWTERRW